jgi:hypothetical protein
MTQQPQNADPQKLTKSESARINGAKSTGATTPEGKIRAANGNLKHGAYSSRVIMDGEDPELYNLLRAYTLDIFKPQDREEAEIVDVLINTRWRLRRLEAAETDALNAAVLLNKPYVEARFESIDVAHERALAIQFDSINMERNTRVEERLHRIYERNLKLLANYRRNFGRSMPEAPAKPSRVEQSSPAQPSEAPLLTDPPNSEAPPLADPPNSNAAPAAFPASLIANIAVLLVIFALLLLAPAETGASNTEPASSFRLLPSVFLLGALSVFIRFYPWPLHFSASREENGTNAVPKWSVLMP